MAGKQGFASMDSETHKKIASLGGKAQGGKSNPGNFANRPGAAAIAGRKGGKASKRKPS